MASQGFFNTLPAMGDFRTIADQNAYVPLPNDWVVGVADVVSSTEAIRQGRYKAVNTAGAAVISAVSNALGTLDFPYVFTGDGMCYAASPDQAAAARGALAASVNWVGAELGLRLRGSEVGVDAIREAGFDVRVARYAPTPDVVYAMFSGGGLAWAEDELKAGRLPALPSDPTAHPDLSGLSCRFHPVQAKNGMMLSLLVSPSGDRNDAGFAALVDDVLAIAATSDEAARPVPAEGLTLGWPPSGFSNEARLVRPADRSLLVSQAILAARTLFFSVVMRVGRTMGSFSPSRYRTELASNADDRKFEDRLMMTVDCSAAVADRIEARLAAAQRAGIADYGLHRQDSALITCVVPSPSRPDHVHFVDGASGGYALASVALKASRAGNNRGPVAPLVPNAIP